MKLAAPSSSPAPAPALHARHPLSRPTPLASAWRHRSSSRSPVVKVLAFQASSESSSSSSGAPPPSGKAVAPSRAALLASLLPTPASGGKRLNVYGRPVAQNELAALSRGVDFWNAEFSNGVPTEREALRQQLLDYLQEAAMTKQPPLSVVEGTMALLEQLFLQEAPAGAKAVVGTSPQLEGALSEEEMQCSWQLCIGADIGQLQYIPVTEVLTVTPPTFDLEADLGGVYMAFQGDADWLTPGHLRYTVTKVRLEFNLPEEWMRALKFVGWRAEQAAAGVSHYNEREQPPLEDPINTPVAATTTEGGLAPVPKSAPSKPHLSIPVPFPSNDLFVFATNGKVAVVRSSMGGLIVLLNRSALP